MGTKAKQEQEQEQEHDQEQGHVISIHISNLTAKDARFLSEVIAFFTDDIQSVNAELIRSGRSLIKYGEKTGSAHVGPVAVLR